MESKENTVFGKNHIFRIFQNNLLKLFWNFRFLISSASILEKKTLFLTFFMVFPCLLLASNVQRWIRDVQKCSSMNQLWPVMSKLKSAGSALNIAENAKISESALKMTEYLWELNPGSYCSPCILLQVSIKATFQIGVKCPWGEMSVGWYFHGVKFPGVKCPGVNCLRGEMSWHPFWHCGIWTLWYFDQ